jgi:hypothetical protein
MMLNMLHEPVGPVRKVHGIVLVLQVECAVNISMWEVCFYWNGAEETNFDLNEMGRDS